MGQTVHCLSVNYNSDSNSGTDCDVDKRVFDIMISEFKLRKGTRVYISINFNLIIV